MKTMLNLLLGRRGAVAGLVVCAFLLPASSPLYGHSVTITNLTVQGTAALAVTSLNATGQVAGYWYDINGVQRAFGSTNGTLFDLGTLGGTTSVGQGINAAGQVVGDSSLPGDMEFHAFVFTGATMFDLGTLGGQTSSAFAINDLGQITGYSYTAFGTLDYHAFLFNGGSLRDLGTLGGSFSFGSAINRSGQVIGDSGTTGDAQSHAFLFDGTVLRDLGTLGGTASSAAALNNLGQVTGNATTTGDLETHAFLFDGTVLRDLGTLGGTLSAGYAVNDAGQVAGDSTLAGDRENHSFVYSGGTLQDLGTLGGHFTSVGSMNNLGQVVGVSSNAVPAMRAFLWQNGTMIDLNTLLPPNSGWVLEVADFINDAGQIAGTGHFLGQPSWFLLTLPGKTPIVANAGPDQVVECAGAGTLVTLDGSASRDPDGEALTYQWSDGNVLLGTTAIIKVGLAFGAHSITLLVTDPYGVSAQATVNVNVVDTTPPTIVCPANFTLAANDQCQAVVPDLLAQLAASDICTASASLVKSQSPTAGSLAALGNNPITITVTDSSGNQATCTTTLTVADTTPPTIVCPAGLTVSADDRGQAAVPDFLATLSAADSCTPAASLQKAQVPAAGTLVTCGATPITITVTDAAGNLATCTTTFTVVDTTPPTVVCPANLTISANDQCQALVPDLLAQLVASDNCTPASALVKSQSPPAGSSAALGNTLITVSVTDAAGNHTTCTTTLTVADTTPPTIICRANVTLSADDHGQAAVPDFLATLSAADTCTPAASLLKAQVPVAGTLVTCGTTTIAITVTDAAGNHTSCTTTFTVVDTTPPNVVCPGNLTVSANDQCQALVPDLLAQLVASDNCTPAAALAKSQSPPAGSPAGLGNNLITITVTDASGNRATCASVLTVVDTTPPTIICPANLTVSADDHGQAVVPDYLATLIAADSCTPAASLLKAQAPVAGALVTCGITTIAITVTDAAGNLASCTTTLTVVDTTPPVVACPANLTILGNDQCQALVPDLLAQLVASDNCTPAAALVKSQVPAAGTVVSFGPNSITLTVSDAAGNATTCAVVLTVSDATPPQIDSITADPAQISPANHKLVPVTISVAATDHCDPAPVSQIISVASNEPLGPASGSSSPDWIITGPLTLELRANNNSDGTTRIYTITVACADAAGNTSTAEVTVAVQKPGKTTPALKTNPASPNKP